MKIRSGMEQGICVVLILSRLPKEATLTSEVISERLDVSHSYLKKLMKVLVHEGLINSSTGKKGGFYLAKPIEKINLYDIFTATEGRGSIFCGQDLISNVIDGDKREENSECAITKIMGQVENKWKESLKEISLDTVMKQVEEQNDIKNIDEWIKTVTQV